MSPSYLGRCPECQAWSSFSEQKTIKAETSAKHNRIASRDALREKTENDADGSQFAVPLASIATEHISRLSTGFAEMDRVLGGGLVAGSYILIGGDPGIGKSTLLLQMASHLSKLDPKAPRQKQILYIAGEESPYQIRLRAERLSLDVTNLLVFADNNIHHVINQLKQLKKSETGLDLVVIDSIQSMYSPDVSGTPGSVSQIKECAGLLMEVAKSLNVMIFLIGHVTKEGAVSGPKLLEHTVDAVLYFEGDKYKNLRILRTVKNRFGNTQEIGVFEMTGFGLQEVANPSQLFLSSIYTGQSGDIHPGSAIVATLEGTRPILTELQALVGQSTYASPRRIANGVETNRLHQIVAVLERRLGLSFAQQDIYINVVGGLSIDEPAADLGIALAIVSSLRNVPLKKGTVLAGEVGLTGEIRPIRLGELRAQEAARIGFERMVLPLDAMPEHPEGLNVIEVQTLMEALPVCLQSSHIPRPQQPERIMPDDEPLSTHELEGFSLNPNESAAYNDMYTAR